MRIIIDYYNVIDVSYGPGNDHLISIPNVIAIISVE